MKELTALQNNVKKLRALFDVTLERHKNINNNKKCITADISGEGFIAYALSNYNTQSLCQVFEVIAGEDGGEALSHRHISSSEIIYVIEGEYTINEQVVPAGEAFIIPPDTAHAIMVSPNSKAIIIIQPTEEAFLY